jgi:hypothetical protein
MKMNQSNKVIRLQYCGIIVPFEQSHRLSSRISVDFPQEMKQKRLNLLKK